MSKYGISLSDGSGKTIITSTSSVNFEDTTKYLTIDHISASAFALNGANNSIITVANGALIPYKAADYSGSYMTTNGSTWIPLPYSLLPVGTASGDLSGSYPNPTFVNISNIATGSLKVANGGLSGSSGANELSSIASGSLIIANSPTSFTAVPTSGFNGIGDWVLGSINAGSTWGLVTASAPIKDINIQYFIGSSTTGGGTYTWTKANSNHKWVRLLIQAGGGGGGGGGTAPTDAGPGSGGGAGGFTDLTMHIGTVSTATVVVGAGGAGASVPVTARNSGENSFFSCAAGYAAAKGGGGGQRADSVGGAGGLGLTSNGSDGGGVGSTAAATLPGDDSIVASGGGGGGYSGTVLEENGGMAGKYTTNTAAPSGNGAFTPNLYGYTIPIGFGTGGRGGYVNAGAGSDGVFGGGGGGSGRWTSGGVSSGGNGGSGFVVVISY